MTNVICTYILRCVSRARAYRQPKLDKRVQECYEYVRNGENTQDHSILLSFLSFFFFFFLTLAIGVRVFLFTPRLYVSGA